MSDHRRCDYRGRYARPGERPLKEKAQCENKATHRVSIGTYACGWRVCEGHVPVLVERGAERMPAGTKIHVSTLDGRSSRIATLTVKAST